MNERFFFHTFPRPRRGEPEEATFNRAIRILRYMADTGLVLAPEIVTWEIGVAGGTIDRLPILQRRASFTELALSELTGHSTVFGPISLSFDIDTLREAGVTPVIYVPQHSGMGSLSQLATFCAKAAWHTRYVLERLQELKVMSDPDTAVARFGKPLAPDCVFNLTNTDPKGKVVAQYAVSAANIQAIMKYIGYRNIPFDHSIGMLSVFLNMFYPTDNAYSGELLGYYRQREWRLIGGVDFNARPIARSLTDKEKARLIKIDGEFWTRELTVEGKQQTRAALALMYDPVQNWRFFDIVRNIYVPRRFEAEARSIAGDKVIGY